MITTSADFLTAIKANARQILLKAYIGDIELTGDNLIDLTVTEAVNTSDGISMGAAISSKLVMKVKTPDYPILLTGNIVKPYVACAGINEWIPLGKFYITEAVSDDDFETTFTITAYDAFSKTESVYKPQISMPNNAAAVLTDIASQCGFPLGQIPATLSEITISQEFSTLDANGTLSFPNGANVEGGALVIGDYVAASKEEINSYTCRQYIGYFAGLLGKNARFDRTGNLIFVWYNNSGHSIPRDLQYMSGCKRLTEYDYTVQSITSGSSGAEIVSGNGEGDYIGHNSPTPTALNEIIPLLIAKGFEFVTVSELM